jgi:hypothetical protein
MVIIVYSTTPRFARNQLETESSLFTVNMCCNDVNDRHIPNVSNTLDFARSRRRARAAGVRAYLGEYCAYASRRTAYYATLVMKTVI